MNAGGKIRLAVRKRQGRLYTQCDDRSVQSLYKKSAAVILVTEALRDGVHMTIAGEDHVQGRYGWPDFSSIHPLGSEAIG